MRCISFVLLLIIPLFYYFYFLYPIENDRSIDLERVHHIRTTRSTYDGRSPEYIIRFKRHISPVKNDNIKIIVLLNDVSTHQQHKYVISRLVDHLDRPFFPEYNICRVRESPKTHIENHSIIDRHSVESMYIDHKLFNITTKII